LLLKIDMRKFALIALSGLTLCLSSTAPARAAIVTVTYNGVVASGSDPVNFFRAGDNERHHQQRRARTFDLGHDDPRPRWNRLYGAPPEINGSNGRGRLAAS
jgi:hypothetical protein